LAIFTITLIATLASILHAQDNEWHVLLYAEDEILRVTADGLVDSIVLPEFAQTFTKGMSYYNVALSSDERYFLFVDESGINYNAQIYLADLTSDDCCTLIPAPKDDGWEVINLLGWSPDGREIVVNYLKAYAGFSDSLLAILNIETGDFRTFFDPTETVLRGNAVYFIGWTEAGIEVIPSCFPCGASADGETMLWNPDTNEITEDYSFTASAWGDRLGNGDIIQSIQHPDYPITNADSMFDPANMVHYFIADNIDDTEIIYFDADNLHLINPQWVIDGHAYVIQQADAMGVTVVWRNGYKQVIEFDNQQVFMVGTPDGWLMTDTAGGQLIQYQWFDGDIVETQLGTYPLLKRLSQLELGADLTDDILPVIDTDL